MKKLQWFNLITICLLICLFCQQNVLPLLHGFHRHGAQAQIECGFDHSHGNETFLECSRECQEETHHHHKKQPSHPCVLCQIVTVPAAETLASGHDQIKNLMAQSYRRRVILYPLSLISEPHIRGPPLAV